MPLPRLDRQTDRRKNEKVRSRFLGIIQHRGPLTAALVELRYVNMFGVVFVRPAAIFAEGCRRDEPPVFFFFSRFSLLLPAAHSAEAERPSHLTHPLNQPTMSSPAAEMGPKVGGNHATARTAAGAERGDREPNAESERTAPPRRPLQRWKSGGDGAVRLRLRTLCWPQRHQSRAGAGSRRATCGRVPSASVAQ